MDDSMEDDIICEVFTVHLHLLWKVVSLTISNIDNMLLHKAGDGSKYKLPNVGSMLLVSFIIFICVLLQTRKNLIKNALLYCNKLFYQSIIVDYNFKNLVAPNLGSGSFTQELAEGIVGVYALQGRRGTMEDKYSVMQEVDVGGSNKLSLFGVYDGHGGQFVAEYVKQHLFMNTVKKIRELRSSLKDKKFNFNKEANERSKRIQKLNSVPQDACESPSQDDSAKSSNMDKEHNTSTKVDSVMEKKKENNNNTTKASSEEKNEKCDTKQDEEMILKKEDPYMNLKLRKKSLAAPVNENKESECKKESVEDSSYIDINSNVNYSKLLSDQIMDIDEKIVNFCKSKTDLSGTTAVIAVLDGELLIIGNVGDSRAVMGDLKGATIPLSFDHKPNQLKERRRIKEAGGFITFTGVWRVAGILATSRALGDFPLKDPRKLITAEPDVLTFSLRDHKAHFVILATDGLWDVMSNEEAVDFVRSHITEWDNGARSLVMNAYEKGSQDNITAMIIDLSKLNL